MRELRTLGPDEIPLHIYGRTDWKGDGPVLLGAGFLHADDSVEVGFALADPEEFSAHPLLGTGAPAIAIFRP